MTCSVDKIMVTIMLGVITNILLVIIFWGVLGGLVNRKFFRGNLSDFFKDVRQPWFMPFPAVILTPLPLQWVYLTLIRREIVDYVVTKGNQKSADYD